jgi:hypothetical protein
MTQNQVLTLADDAIGSAVCRWRDHAGRRPRFHDRGKQLALVAPAQNPRSADPRQRTARIPSIILRHDDLLFDHGEPMIEGILKGWDLIDAQPSAFSPSEE